MARTEVSIKRNVIVLIKPHALSVPVLVKRRSTELCNINCYRLLGVRFPALYFFPYAILAPFLSI